MSPTHHYLDTFRDRIKPGLSILYGGNPCRGNHRVAQGGGERRPCAALPVASSEVFSVKWNEKTQCSLVIPYLWPQI